VVIGARAARMSAVVAVALSWAAPAVAEQEQVGEFEFSPMQDLAIRSVDVENFLGDVKIEGHDRNVIAISFRKQAPDPETLDRLKVAFTPDPRGAVTIATSLGTGPEARPVPAGSIRVDLVVKVPRATRPRVSVWKGEVGVRGVDNGAEVSANEGDIEVRHVSGAISTRTAQGHHQFAEVVGATIDASAVEGDMDLDAVGGDRLRAVVHRGHVSGRKVRFREITVRTTRGDIRLEAEVQSGGRYRLVSYQGNVELVLSGDRPARVAAETARGQVTIGEGLEVDQKAIGSVIALLGRKARSPAEILVRSTEGHINVNVAVATW
jgi:hypothetical protein